MEIVLENTKSKYLEIFSLLDLDNIHETFKRFSSIKEPLDAKIFAVNETISSNKFSKLKNHFDKINIRSLCIYSNNRETILTGKYLKIDSICVFLSVKLFRKFPSSLPAGCRKVQNFSRQFSTTCRP